MTRFVFIWSSAPIRGAYCRICRLLNYTMYYLTTLVRIFVYMPLNP